MGDLRIVRKLLLEHAPGRGEGVDDRERRGAGDYAAVTEAAAVTKEHDIPRLRRLYRMSALQQNAQIHLLAAMQMPVGRIRARVERRDEAEVDKHPHEQHR